jgi:hypothetical protein
LRGGKTALSFARGIRRLSKQARAHDVTIEVGHLMEVESILHRHCLY